MLVYKALRHRAIPMWVKRDYEQERVGKIDYLENALSLFMEKCEREGITSFAAYDERYMVHYRSGEWVSDLVNLVEDHDTPKRTSVRDSAIEIWRKFDHSNE